ncbi:MAG: hypothetical protein SNJ60_05780 [Pseudanabaenaceae cyanobacterium]
MADYEHLRQLRQGTESWNRWRQRHPKVAIDLSGVDLVQWLRSDFDLREFDWAAADIAPDDFGDRFAFQEFDLEDDATAASGPDPH